MALNHTLSRWSTKAWVERQAQDPFVGEARRRGYVARSALKLSFLQSRFKLFSNTTTRVVVDLGCSPGGWLQVVRENTNDACSIIGVDLLPVRAQIPQATFIQGDFTTDAVQAQLLECLTGASPSSSRPNTPMVDVVTSDMCPNRLGGAADRQRSSALNLQAAAFAVQVLRPGGHFVCKVLGSRVSYEELDAYLRRHYLTLHVSKPPASRRTSDEAFLVACNRLEEPRGRPTSTANGDRYGLDDWPGFSRTSGRGGSRH